MNKPYDATQEFKPFSNRGKGGALVEALTYTNHPNKDGYRKWAGKPNKSQHRPNRRVRASIGGDIRNGYVWNKV